MLVYEAGAKCLTLDKLAFSPRILARSPFCKKTALFALIKYNFDINHDN